MSLEKVSYPKNWSYIKERAFQAGSKLIENHNDVEDLFFKSILGKVSHVILRKRIEKVTDQEVLQKYISDYHILKEFFDEIEVYEGMENVSREFGMPNLTKMKTLNNNLFEG